MSHTIDIFRPLKSSLKSVAKLIGIDISYLRMETAYKVQKKLTENKNDPIVFDVGASVGQTTAKYLNLHPSSHIYAFEPFPDVFKSYNERTTSDRVRSYCLALSNTIGSSPFFSNVNHYTNSLLDVRQENRESNSALKSVGNIPVKTTTIDSFCEKERIVTIDILKLDIQGGELSALKGAEGLLKKKKIGLIYAEVSFIHTYENQPLLPDLVSYLAQHEYALYGLYNVSTLTSGVKDQADAIFVPNEKVYERV